ncbi:MAG TPA: chaperone modulator CbpM [Prosthecobacter sp.]|nr:chaperone modulator CbpM [Prosthecobacter sp.]
MSELVVRQSETFSTYSIETTAELTGVEHALLRKYCELGLLGPARASSPPDPMFDEDAIYEVRRIEHFRRHFGLDLETLPLICGLLQEVERLRAELRHLRD